jgi:hypothetical protein
MNSKVLKLLWLTVLAGCCTPLLHAAGTITITPASLSLKGQAGKMYTQNFKVANITDVTYTFKIDVADVLVEEGKRKFVPAGQTPLSLAATVTAARGEVVLAPGQDAVVPVTFIMPAESHIRAVAVFFHGVPNQVAPNTKRIFMNLGAVVDFSLSNEVMLDSQPLEISPQTATTNTVVQQELSNVGPEPTIVRGVAAFLDQSGKLVSKSAFEQKRFLPGERNAIHAEFAGTLPPGKYRVISSLEFSGQTLTKTADLTIP